MTNYCIFDCAYCVNRVSSNTPRARFSPEELIEVTLAFYRRNYIEGLFLSSGIIRNSDYTMEQMIRIVRGLRIDHGFNGYIHMKLIPDASPELVREAGLYADRVSVNIELPRDESLASYAPEKDPIEIKKAMGKVRLSIDEHRPDRKARHQPEKFAPAGQSTQLIVGADGASDGEILGRSQALYGGYQLRRVYYSAFSPIPDSTARLPLQSPPLVREHRLYQADWLLRFYGFERGEIVGDDANLDLEIDPKLSWALKNRGAFPVDVNRGDREMLLRVPGLGVRTIDRLIRLRRLKNIRLEDVKQLCRSGFGKARPFIVTADYSPGALPDDANLKDRFLRPAERQLSLF